ncbi:MAG: CehA/McbA family metallohydrolase [Elusimicrobia bacterium]|nr:CehA/McbA family metallohydrolase [Candidatus Liberimonas magnetica]
MIFEKNRFDYPGAIHIHTQYSFDGNTGVKDIVSSAKKNGLKFIIITDHFSLEALKEGWEGWHDGVLVLVGEEISPRYNHYLAFNIKEPVLAQKDCNEPQSYIDKVQMQGGFGFIAHPDHTGAKKFRIKDYPWIDWSVEGYTAMSIWDLMTDWQENLTSVLKALFSYIFPAWVLKGAKNETLFRWDELNKTRKISGYGEIDNHNSKKQYFGLFFKIFPFDFAFSTIRTHLVLNEALNNDYERAKEQIYGAIKSFSLYVCQERWNKTGGFVFSIKNSKNSAYYGGEINILNEDTKLEVLLPSKGKIRVICNGGIIKEEVSKRIEIKIENAGIYRVEIYQKKLGFYKPWIYSNPIWVK